MSLLYSISSKKRACPGTDIPASPLFLASIILRISPESIFLLPAMCLLWSVPYCAGSDLP